MDSKPTNTLSGWFTEAGFLPTNYIISEEKQP